MKKHLKKLIMGALAGSMLPAMAVPAMAGGPGVRTMNSDAEIEFTTGSGPNFLYLDNVPVLDFGQHALAPSDYYYTATATNLSLEVVDIRGGTPTIPKWDVEVTLGEFKDAATSTIVGLQGAEISFRSYSTYLGKNTVNAAGGVLNGTGGITGSHDASYTGVAPEVPAAVTVKSNDVAKEIFKAAVGVGVGRWGAHWLPGTGTTSSATSQLGTNGDVEMKVVFGTAQAYKYKADMEWVLKATP